ncbi:MAG: redoxin domain-containing protein [Muribaculaceae bacterium]|nr:redoxin domain-containing protein [Muribaculaceae bacterium]
MKKTVKYILFCVAVALMVAVFALRVNREDTDPRAVPHITSASNTTGHVNLSDLRGKYVLVNFWDSHNAVSRIAAGEYDRYIKQHPGQNIRLLSVNTDDNRRLYDEIVRHDGLDVKTQYHVSDTKVGGHTTSFQPEEGYASYLVDPQGEVVAVNPSVGTLENLLDKH